ncbi:TolC family protein [Parabacteroides bouchesdurhonensis]|uniref:TolC family protein n=1 Tax=Parabacteroides bouchesdurhonensis TaxID=1936995 RepID=UPI000E46AE4A|nr:TolC family protein [Parabacteroides bouchesdurhonensis]RHJ92440.1 TolC family protein [Bacteroides sp. AM07-16]
MKRNIILFSIAAFSLSSCGIYKTYKPIDSVPENLYRTDNSTENDTASIASLAWQELFTDPYLQELIEEGLANNTDMRTAHLKVQEAEASLLTSRLAYLPALSLNPQGTLSSFDGSKTAKSYQLAASASWEIDIFGKLTNAKRSAQAALAQSKSYRQAVRTQLIATIANTYYTLLLLDDQFAISERTAALWKENVQAMRALMKAGLRDEAAVSQAEANCLAVEASLLTLRKQINETENSLSTLLGKVPQKIGRGTLNGQQFPQQLTAGLPVKLLNNRPDVKQAEAALAQAFYSTNEARSYFYPNITLSGTAGWTNNGGGIITNPGALLLQAIGSLTQPLFNKGTNIARLKIAKAQQEEAALAFQQSLLNAGSEVNNALTQWQTARQRIVLGEKQITSLETAVRSTRLLMDHGTTTYLEVLTAQQTLLQTQLTQSSDRFDEIQGIIGLYQSLGGG